MSTHPQLRFWLKSFYVDNPEIATESAKKHYRDAISMFRRYLDHEPVVDDLTDDNVVGLMHFIKAKGHTANTVNSLSRYIRRLWRYLCEKGAIHCMPTVRGLPPDPPPAEPEISEDTPTLRDFYDDVFRPHWLGSCNHSVLIRFYTTVDGFSAWRPDAKMADLKEKNLREFAKWLADTGRARTGPSRLQELNGMHVKDCVSRLRQIRRFYQLRKYVAPQDMLLTRFYMEVYVAERQPVTNTKKTFRKVIKSLCDHHGSDVMLSELCPEVIEPWTKYLEEKYGNPDEPKRRRQIIESVWRFARELGYVSTSPDKDQLPPPKPIVAGGDSLRAIMVNRYFHERLEITNEKTRCQYRFALNDFEKCLGHDPKIPDLTDENIFNFVRWMQANKDVTPKTINERTGRIKTFWRWCAAKGMIRLWPTAGKLREPVTTPRAWTEEELRRLFAAAREIKKPVGAIRGADWWTAFLMMLWNTGERKTALMSVRWDWIDANGVLSIPAEARKSRRKEAIYQLWSDTVTFLRVIDKPQRDVILHWPGHDSRFYQCYSELIKLAGLPPGRKSGPHSLRVSHASWLNAIGGDATKALGHSSPETTHKSYLDPRIGIQPVKLFKPWEEPGGEVA